MACRVRPLVNGSAASEARCPTVTSVIPRARYEEIRTGHYMAVQTPDLIFDRIDAFLRAVDA